MSALIDCPNSHTYNLSHLHINPGALTEKWVWIIVLIETFCALNTLEHLDRFTADRNEYQSAIRPRTIDCVLVSDLKSAVSSAQYSTILQPK